MKYEIILTLREFNRPHPPNLPLLQGEGGARKIQCFTFLSF
ncbi:hypothetical protein NIES2100_49330 [Calothrix sp. NIES-2100]|nr:hypothetical protein NIES2100_49330 [Calothrix sp. NIES-2100]